MNDPRSRRSFLLALGAPLALGVAGCARAARPAAPPAAAGDVTIEEFDAAGKSVG
jgi:hypothetical protein